MGPLPALLAAAIILPVAAAAGIEAFADHSTVAVTNAGGSSVPGCEETNECFIPHVITVTVGSNVIWTNSDNAAHTVTSGVLSEGGPDGLFDSGLFSPGAEFSHTFTEAGRHPYFCLVHPWMEGAVLVVRETDGVTDHGGTAVYEPETIEPSAVGRMSDGTIVEVRAAEPAAGEPMNINVAFVDSEHVNYDILVMQGDTVLLSQKGAHFHGGVGDHRTPPLKSGDPVYIDITFQGFGVATITGPVGYHVAFVQMMPWPGPEMSGMVDLAGEDLSYADLRGADLAWADLRGADLSYAYLQSANLFGADLAWADLRGADLSYADLRGANLSYAYLQSANLYGANLAGADLAWADLTRAFLWEADFSDAGHAYLGGAHLRFADFTAANLAGGRPGRGRPRMGQPAWRQP